MIEVFEAMFNFLRFWRFIFSKKYRYEFIDKFKRLNPFRKTLEIIGVVISTIIGIGLPIIIVYIIVSMFEVTSDIDSCLDNGGSFNYETCECDFKVNHVKISEHSCY